MNSVTLTHSWEITEEVIAPAQLHCMMTYSCFLLSDFGRNWLTRTKCSEPLPNYQHATSCLFSKWDIVNICREMFEIHRACSGHVYYPSISELYYQSSINPCLFIFINLVGMQMQGSYLLWNYDKYLKSAKSSPLVTQAGSVGKPVWSSRAGSRKEKMTL